MFLLTGEYVENLTMNRRHGRHTTEAG